MTPLHNGHAPDSPRIPPSNPMTPTSHGHDLTRNDPADTAPCPMERLADRMNDCPKPKFLECGAAARLPTGEVMFSLIGTFYSPDSIDDLINYLARVKG